MNTTTNKWRKYFKTILKDWRLYTMLIPIIVFFTMWKYFPISGQLIAFKDYNVNQGVFGSDFKGFYYVKDLMFGQQSAQFWRSFKNTFVLSLYGLVFGFPVPILLAIMFSEIKSAAYRSITQILVYLPKFISTVVITSIVTMLLRSGTAVSSPGAIAQLLYALGIGFGENGDKLSILYQPQYFRAIYHVSGIWQGAGYSSIVYFAAIMSISPTNFEAAKVDGANKLAQIRYVTLPGIGTTLTIMLILRMGRMLTIGFEKVLLLYNTTTYDTADVISTFVYRIGLVEGNSEIAAAADLFNAIIAMTLVLAANFISRRVSETSLF